MGYFNQALLFMRAHENLAGWAQAFGAMLAIVFAIGVPAYQRYAQTLDTRRERASLNLVLASSGFFLLTDIQIFLNGLVGDRAHMPRGYCRDDVLVSDLLERIRSLEAREVSHARLISLFSARGALTLTNRDVADPNYQNHPLLVEQITLIKKRSHRGLRFGLLALQVPELGYPRSFASNCCYRHGVLHLLSPPATPPERSTVRH
jgi:hypothetical protein